MYDFSYADFNIHNREPTNQDLGVMVLLLNELEQLTQDKSTVQSWLKLFTEQKANIAVILALMSPLSPEDPIIRNIFILAPNAFVIPLLVDVNYDPMMIRQQIALKMLLNAHSTAVMAKLGKVVGNTMTNVRPGNLKLIGRATYLIQTHVNDVLPKIAWSKWKDISYADANAVLFNVIEYMKNMGEKNEEDAPVALSIIRILESVRTNRSISWEDTIQILNTKGLEQYLNSFR